MTCEHDPVSSLPPFVVFLFRISNDRRDRAGRVLLRGPENELPRQLGRVARGRPMKLKKSEKVAKCDPTGPEDI